MTEQRKIDAAPTKDFFIHMLVRDIELIPAIGDLVDNSIDGARRMHGDGPYEGLFIRLALGAETFTIEDNCGGIPLELAEKYAFRFGRPEEMQDTPHSIGQFGVGMKRALFKLGNAFEIQSTTASEHFEMEVDVREWRAIDEWEFEFRDYGTDLENTETGTSIMVSALHRDTKNSFANKQFQTRLARTIGAQHQSTIAQGMVITVNGTPVGARSLRLLNSALMTPASQTLTLEEDSDTPVTVRLFVGLGEESSPPEAGWYVYCNGRLVLDADKSAMTGWGVGDESRFPRFHNRYGRFRGYAFFDSDDASKLPWTTTKTALDSESSVYQAALQSMLLLARPVTQFLYDLSVEVEKPPKEGTELERVVSSANPIGLTELASDGRFKFKRPKAPPQPRVRMQSVQYKRPIEEIAIAKRILGVNSATEVGQKTFEYFLKREADQDE